MQAATAETVLGNFDNAEFQHGGITSRFFRRGEKFMVRTDGPDGALGDYGDPVQVRRDALQQYLVEFREAGNAGAALPYARKLAEVLPDDSGIKRLVVELEAMR